MSKGLIIEVRSFIKQSLTIKNFLEFLTLMLPHNSGSQISKMNTHVVIGTLEFLTDDL